MSKTLCSPRLGECDLAFRIDMARKRLRSYPLDSMEFIMLDLERPEDMSRQADWWTGDLTGRILEFLSFADGVTEQQNEWVHTLFERILRTRQPDGLFGRKNQGAGHNKLLIGLLRYYERFGDGRALEAALGIGERMLVNPDHWMNPKGKCYNGMAHWMTEPFAELYRLTGEARWLEAIEMLRPQIGDAERVHAHNYLSALRGLQRTAEVTGDTAWAAHPEAMRRKIIERKYPNAAGDICEGLPWTSRNEACATADWIRLNLNAGLFDEDDAAYEQAEHSLRNALFFAQIVTGGLGHRSLAPWGYDTSEFQEAWWCCTMNSGMAMADVARHAVTLSGDTLRVNFFLPGTFTLRRGGQPLTVRMTTRWPERAWARIQVVGDTRDLKVHVRVPGCVKDAHTEVASGVDGALTVRFEGEIGYTLDAWDAEHATLRYGALLLAPMCYTIGGFAERENERGIPTGYRNSDLPSGWLTLLPPAKDERGFYTYAHEPVPDWTYFEEGLCTRTGSGNLSVSGDALLSDGRKKTLRFWPLGYAISTLIFYPTPILFRVEQGGEAQ